MIWAFLTSTLGKVVIGIVVAALLGGSIYLKGRADGRAKVLSQLAADRVTVLKDGKAIDDAADLLDDVGLCDLLGGCGMSDEAAGH